MYEVAWTRLLALVIGPTTYAFATMAAAFISGLAMGSALGTRLARARRGRAVWLAMMLVAAAIAASPAACVAGDRGCRSMVAAQVADPDAAFGESWFRQALGTALLLLPMTLALGRDVSARACGSPPAARDALGADAARVYSANTLGAIAGCARRGVRLHAAAGPALDIPDGRRRRRRRRRAASRSLLARDQGQHAHRGLGTARAHRAGGRRGRRGRRDRDRCRPGIARCSSSGAYKYAPYLRMPTTSRPCCAAGKLVYYREGAAGDGHRPPADRHDLARDRRQGRRVERRRHADAAHARARAAAAPSQSAGASRSSVSAAASRSARRSRHPRRRRRRARDLAGGRRGVAVLRAREPSRARRPARPR